MILWLILAGLMAIALGFLIRPMLRGPREAATDTEHDIEVYRDQLAEIERDRERGAIDEEAAEAARLEIQRRMIAADARAKPAPAARPMAQGPVLAIALVVPLVAGSLYLGLGRPELIGAEPPAQTARRGPTAEDMRRAADMSPEQRARMIRGMVESLAARLKENPRDLRGWLRLGRAWEVLGEGGKAKEAYARAAEFAPDDVEVQSRYMMAMVRVHPKDRPLSAEMKGQIDRLLALDAANPLGLYFAGVVAVREGRVEAGLVHWRKLLPRLPEDSPLRKQLVERIAALEARETQKGAPKAPADAPPEPKPEPTPESTPQPAPQPAPKQPTPPAE